MYTYKYTRIEGSLRFASILIHMSEWASECANGCASGRGKATDIYVHHGPNVPQGRGSTLIPKPTQGSIVTRFSPESISGGPAAQNEPLEAGNSKRTT